MSLGIYCLMSKYIIDLCEFKLIWEIYLFKCIFVVGEFVGYYGGEDFRVFGYYFDGLFSLFFCDFCINLYILLKVVVYNKI